MVQYSLTTAVCRSGRIALNVDDVGDLTGKRVAVGLEGSGTRADVLNLLKANGIDSQTVVLPGLPTDELPNAFLIGQIDFAFVMGAPESASIVSLVNLQGVRLHNLRRADAYTRRYSYLSDLTIPQGVLDLQANRPETDISTVASSAMVAANWELLPALVDLLLVAASDSHTRRSRSAPATRRDSAPDLSPSTGYRLTRWPRMSFGPAMAG